MTSSLVGCAPESVKACAGLGLKDELRGFKSITCRLFLDAADLLIVNVMSTWPTYEGRGNMSLNNWSPPTNLETRKFMVTQHVINKRS
jgi:hypothetical protein